VAIVESVTNDPEMTVADITIGVLDRETREVRAFRFTPQELDELGPKALAERLFTAA
jgi:hypothetical protein